jgi:citronellol/citronellal dehydrogenase
MQPVIRRLREHVPLGRLALEAEVSSVIVFLLSPAAAFVTGITVQIDGGATLGNPLFPRLPVQRQAPFAAFHRAVPPKVLGAG